MEYGYIRVSTKEQNEDRQLIALREMSPCFDFHCMAIFLIHYAFSTLKIPQTPEFEPIPPL